MTLLPDETVLAQANDLPAGLVDDIPRAWRGLPSPRRTAAPIASAYPLIVEGACDHRSRSRMVRMEAMARASSTEGFNDVLATLVRADEIVATDPVRTPVE